MIPWDNEEGFYAAFGDFLGARWRAPETQIVKQGGHHAYQRL